MAARPLVTVYNISEKGRAAAGAQVKLPSVFLAPIRPDLVQDVFTSMNKNRRQPYAVSVKAGHQHSAESWGTGRAVSRIPRVSGGGTHRAGQAAFGNMCRKGRMFAPTKIWRKWHRKINVNQRRFAVVSALAASALPSLVMARGHRIGSVPQVPLVLGNSVESLTKTAKALAALTAVKAHVDVRKSKFSKKLRAGVGKLRNRRHVMRRGPLVVYANDNGLTQAFRNLPGVDLCHVSRLNLLQLAPGGHLGRFVIWTQAAFEQLDAIYGTQSAFSLKKAGYKLPRPLMTNSDLTRIINSESVQTALRPKRAQSTSKRVKKNPLKNLGALVKLNPYALTLRRREILSQQSKQKAVHAAKKLAAAKAHRKTKAANYARIIAEDEYQL